MTSKSRLLSSVVNKPESLIGASLSQPNEVNLQALETAATQYTDVTTLPASGYVGEQAFVASTNRLYIWTGTGWFNIALVNTDPTISSAGDANYTMSYGTPITVNVDASDPEGLGLSYSYYTSDSVGSIATITNDSSQFTITPSSDYSVEGSFGLVFRASDGPNIASSSSSTFTLTNQAPSLSGNSASYVLATDGSTPTVITLTSVDPEGQPITYTATGDSGFNAIATVSNDSSVFTIIPKSEDSAVSGTGSLTFTASDGIKSTNGTSSFSITFISTITNSKYTTLLATATDTSDNNNITDASSNSHNITVNGDAYAGTFSPYRSGGYSTFFGRTRLNNPSGDPTEAITATLSSQIGTGDFSFSYWVYVEDPSTGPDPKRHFDLGGSGVKLYQSSNTSMRLQIGGSTVLDYAALGTLSIKSWHYVSVTRSSGTVAVHFDGILAGSTTNTTDITQTNFRVGAGTTNDITYGLIGYVRDFMVKNVAVYSVTENYTVPDSAAESDSDTLILLCSLPYHADGSSNDLTLDLYPVHNGVAMTVAPEIHTFSPYDYTEYAATDHGGSVYFDGSTDYLISDISSNIFSVGTGDFTVEGWFYFPDDTTDISIIGSGISGGFDFRRVNDRTIRIGQANASWDTTSAPLSLANQWCYIAAVRSSGTVSIYVNGVAQTISSGASNTENYNPGNHRISVGYNGYGSARYGYGNYADIRLTTSAVYSSNFTPPTAPLSSTGAALHIKGTDASIIDKSQGSNLKLFGNATGSTTQVKFADTKSMYFDGNDYMTTNPSAFHFGTDDFTIEFWYYANNLSSQHTMCDVRNNGSNGYYPLITQQSSVMKYYVDSAFKITGTTTLNANTWYHVAVVRSSGTTTLYLNGSAEGNTWSDSTDFPLSATAVIGSNANNTTGVNGYLQDFRVTKDLARYTANFTPPTAPLES